MTIDARDDGAVATERRRAKAFWAQRRASLSLRFDARDAREIEIEVEDADSVGAGRSIVRVSYVARLGDEGEPEEDGSASDASAAFECELELYGAVAPARKAEIKRTAHAFTVVFRKTTPGAHWPRLSLTKEKSRFVATDFDAWMDEDDEAAADAAFKFDLSSLEKISNYEDKSYYFPDVDDSDDDMPDMTDVYDA